MSELAIQESAARLPYFNYGPPASKKELPLPPVSLAKLQKDVAALQIKIFSAEKDSSEEPKSLKKRVCTVLRSASGAQRYPRRIVDVAKNVIKACHYFFAAADFFDKLYHVLKKRCFAVVKLAGITFAPLYFYAFWSSLQDYRKEGSDKLKALFHMVDFGSDFLDTIVSTLGNLCHIGVLDESHMRWIEPLEIFGLVTSVTSIINGWSGWGEAEQFLQEWDRQRGELERLRFIKGLDKKRVGRFFGAEQKVLNKKVSNLFAQSRIEKQPKVWKEGMAALRGRIKQRLNSKRLTVIGTSMNLIASLTISNPLFAVGVPPLLGVLYGVKAFGYALALNEYWTVSKADKKFALFVNELKEVEVDDAFIGQFRSLPSPGRS